jgi:hypothetical protein
MGLFQRKGKVETAPLPAPQPVAAREPLTVTMWTPNLAAGGNVMLSFNLDPGEGPATKGWFSSFCRVAPQRLLGVTQVRVLPRDAYGYFRVELILQQGWAGNLECQSAVARQARRLMHECYT